jgi:hypothetical protein
MDLLDLIDSKLALLESRGEPLGEDVRRRCT